ncbi:MAG: class I SAM-dependent methyltransferase [Patescibacteria group bacterium]|nr:class I SAM-dependent methyltransferase [Patescibacteria group bacterium]MDE1945791.1 class I SAM-dependent methyltransferase [Patescibacteria group bacterium]
MIEPKTLITKPSRDYELLDSGNGEKLERWGKYVLRRPDPQALWNKNLPESEWKSADAVFDANKKVWKKKNESMRNEWQVSFGDVKFNVKPTAFKHTGVFPEQEPNWQWTAEKIQNAGRPVKVLNLFGYTGGATLAALSAGADVTHVDGSKAAVNWAKENAAISDLDKKPVRWLVDDARKFVMREIKRGGKYDAIVMDPPAFGRGGKGEIWKIETDLLKLLEDCAKILSDDPLFFIVNGYASGYSATAYVNALEPIMKTYGGAFEHGELAIQESKSERLLPAGIFVRFSK